MKTMPLCFALSLLPACGLISTPQLDVTDSISDLPLSLVLTGKVAYTKTDSFQGRTMPSILQQAAISGQARYTGAGNMTGMKVYVRPSLNPLPSGCTELATAVICDAATETAQEIGTLEVSLWQAVPFVLTGAALDQAAKSGHGYMGMQVTQGTTLPGDKLEMISMKIGAKL